MTTGDRFAVVGAGILLVLVFGACVTPRPVGEPGPYRVDVLVGDARAGKYGGDDAARVVDHPDLRDEVRGLFGRDWAAGRPLGPSVGAREFFVKPFPTRMLRVAGEDWVAAPGCIPAACATHRGLVLVRADGERLLARLDDGGFTFYYVRGIGLEATPEVRELVDAAWRAMQQTGGWARALDARRVAAAPR